MADLSTPKHSFEIPGIVTLTQGEGGLDKIVLTTEETDTSPCSHAEIYLNGATVTRYEVEGRQLLFLSRTSKYALGKAIRGGVPVIFPWFGPHPTDPKLPQHGFVRAAEWTVDSARRLPSGEVSVTLAFESSDATRLLWPCHFSLRYTVTVGRRLTMALEVTNRSASEFRFEEALHSYLAVSDVRLIHITGLEHCAYFDKVEDMALRRQGDGALRLAGETDRVFVNTDADCHVHDSVNGDILVRKENSLSTIIWNPWETKAEALPDLAGDRWHGMVCVETANALENAILLAPGATHTMIAIIEPA